MSVTHIGPNTTEYFIQCSDTQQTTLTPLNTKLKITFTGSFIIKCLQFGDGQLLLLPLVQ